MKVFWFVAAFAAGSMAPVTAQAAAASTTTVTAVQPDSVAQALKNLDPLATAQLDRSLTQYTQQQSAIGMPVEGAAAAAGGAPDAGNP